MDRHQMTHVTRPRHAAISQSHLPAAFCPCFSLDFLARSDLDPFDRSTRAGDRKGSGRAPECRLPAEPSAIREKIRTHQRSRNMQHATSYTYKLNVAYFIIPIPKDFWYSEAPCTTSTFCHLETVVSRLSEMSTGDSAYYCSAVDYARS